MTIRPATLSDAEAIHDLYAPYVLETCISFETVVPTIEAFKLRMESIIRDYPYLVCEADGVIAGYAYASKHRERAAYRFSADVSVYVAPGYHRKGIGKSLYLKLFELLKEQGIYTVFAGVTLPNDNSIGLHKSLGFTEVGTFKHTGYKFGKWLDVLWLQKALRDYDTPQEEEKNGYA